MLVRSFAACLFSLLPVAVLAVPPACPQADTEALRWLEKMSHSSHELNYEGVVTVQRGDDMQVVQVSHRASDGTSTETLTRLTGQGARVERISQPQACVHPGVKLLQLGDAIKLGQCGVANHYRFKVTDGDRVAGRDAVRLKVSPRDMYRFGYVMDLDRETGLLLKTKILGPGDKTLEKFQFANLSYGPPIAKGTTVDTVHETTPPCPEHPIATIPGKRQWRVRWLPDGFMATDSAAGAAERRSYTDGLAVFSVFLEELPREIRPGEGVVRQGSTTSYTRGLRLADQPVLVTVIGEVPVNTARMVADSITWDTARAD